MLEYQRETVAKQGGIPWREENRAAIRITVPLSITMSERVEVIREWGRTRARGTRAV